MEGAVCRWQGVDMSLLFKWFDKRNAEKGRRWAMLLGGHGGKVEFVLGGVPQKKLFAPVDVGGKERRHERPANRLGRKERFKPKGRKKIEI